MRVCKNNKRGICKGCGRTAEEIAGWKNLDAGGRHEINLRLLATRGKEVRNKLLKDIKKAAEGQGLG